MANKSILAAFERMWKHIASALDNKSDIKHTHYNILDNSDFTNPVNQRNNILYDDSTGYPTIDRWRKTTNSECYLNNKTFELVCLDSSNDGFESLFQRIENGKIVAGRKYTLVVKTIDEEDYAICVSAPVLDDGQTDNKYTEQCNIDDIAFFRMGLQVDGIYQFRISVYKNKTLSLKSAALYEGEYTVDNLPMYQPKGFAAEYTECARYYQKVWLHRPVVSFKNTSTMLVNIPMPIDMRIKPTITVDGEYVEKLRIGGDNIDISLNSFNLGIESGFGYSSMAVTIQFSPALSAVSKIYVPAYMINHIEFSLFADL